MKLKEIKIPRWDYSDGKYTCPGKCPLYARGNRIAPECLFSLSKKTKEEYSPMSPSSDCPGHEDRDGQIVLIMEK